MCKYYIEIYDCAIGEATQALKNSTYCVFHVINT